MRINDWNIRICIRSSFAKPFYYQFRDICDVYSCGHLYKKISLFERKILNRKFIFKLLFKFEKFQKKHTNNNLQ